MRNHPHHRHFSVEKSCKAKILVRTFGAIVPMIHLQNFFKSDLFLFSGKNFSAEWDSVDWDFPISNDAVVQKNGNKNQQPQLKII